MTTSASGSAARTSAHRAAWRAATPLLLLAGAAMSRAAGAQAGSVVPPGSLPAITAAELNAHLRFLSSDLLEGRAPDARGGRIAAAYVAAQLQASGVYPGADDSSYVQRVPLATVTVDPASVRVALSGRASSALRWGDDLVLDAPDAAIATSLRGEIVFVGYGISAPARGWDDYAGADVRGKVVLALPGEPLSPDTLRGRYRLGGREPSWWGSTPAKREEAERRGAVAFMAIYPADDPPLPWTAFARQLAMPVRQLPRDSAAPALAARITIREEAAAALLRGAGLELAQLRERAAATGFRALPTGVTLEASFRSAVTRTYSENVVGYVRSRDARSNERLVVLTAHWDHLGVGAPVGKDSIYNGALDNASGVALMLAVARAAAQGPPPARSLIFLFTTGAESGLLGARWFAAHPTVPLANVDAVIDVDGANLWGRSYDVVAVGGTKSSLGAQLESVAARQGLRVTPDPLPEQGYLLRSDQLPFALAGVPAILVKRGVYFVGRPPEWGLERARRYIAEDYRRPSDEYRTDFELAGLVQQAEVVRAFALAVANTRRAPTWAPGGELARPAPLP